MSTIFRTCRTCHNTKALRAFPKNRKHPHDTLTCRVCERVRCHTCYWKNPTHSRALAAARQRTRALKKKAIKALLKARAACSTP